MKAWVTWVDHTAAAAQKKIALRHAILFMQSRALGQAWRTWRANARTQAWQGEQIEQRLLKLRKRTVAVSLAAWQTHSQRKRIKHQVHTFITCSFVNCCFQSLSDKSCCTVNSHFEY